MAISMIDEIRRVAASHDRNGEPYTSDLLFRAADHVAELQEQVSKLRKRLERLSAG